MPIGQTLSWTVPTAPARMPSEPYRVGLVGCGEIGRRRAAGFRELPDTELVAVSDINQDAAADAAAEFDVPNHYGDPEELFAAEDLDIVQVSTWHGTHASITIEAAEAGVPGIICEKPMCTSLGEAKDMVDAAERNDVKLTVKHGRRYRPANVRARELIAEGAIGEPRVLLARTDAGLLNWGTHLINQAQYVLGDPEIAWVMGQVERKTDRHERREPIEDRCAAQVAFENGARLSFECDLPGPETAEYANSLQIFGSAGQLIPRDGLTVLDADGQRVEEPAGRESSDPHVTDLIAWMEGEREDHRCAGHHAIRTVELMMSIYESLRTRGVVEAPLTTRANPLELMIERGDLPVEHPGAYDIRIPYESVR